MEQVTQNSICDHRWNSETFKVKSSNQAHDMPGRRLDQSEENGIPPKEKIRYFSMLRMKKLSNNYSCRDE